MSSSETNGGDRKRKVADVKGTSSVAEEPMPNDVAASSSCPYLDTIQRSLLDFDFEPSCSVSLQSGPHIYGCLVCGKFFRGRGPQTPAYTHSAQEGHFVFVHLANSKFYCLPDNYEIQDPSLSDIAAALHPTYTPEEIAQMDVNTALARDLFGRRYLPGFVGLNNLNKTDCINACVQALAHVPPLRDFFLRQDPTAARVDVKSTKSTASSVVSAHRLSQHVADCFGGLVRKLWSDRRYKNAIDPHMLTQGIAAASRNRFRIGRQMEAGEFMAWFLHQLHLGLGGSSRKPGSSIVHKIFQGRVQVTTRQLTPVEVAVDDDDLRGASDEEEDDQERMEAEEEEERTKQQQQTTVEETTMDSHFLQLTLDISQKPLFRDANGGLVIPQEPLVTVLKKFDGVSFSDVVNKAGVVQRRRYRIRQLPPYLILHLARFQSNKYIKEKNPTIVAFPVRNLDLSDYVFPTDECVTNGRKERQKTPSEEEVRAMSIKELKELLTKHGREDLWSGSLEKSELVDRAVDFVTKSLPDLLSDKYDLVANISHEIPAEVGREGQHDPLQAGSYKCHVQQRSSKCWYEIQDLHVQEIMPQLVGLSESYLLIFERKSASTILAKSLQQSSNKKTIRSKKKPKH